MKYTAHRRSLQPNNYNTLLILGQLPLPWSQKLPLSWRIQGLLVRSVPGVAANRTVKEESPLPLSAHTGEVEDKEEKGKKEKKKSSKKAKKDSMFFWVTLFKTNAGGLILFKAKS